MKYFLFDIGMVLCDYDTNRFMEEIAEGSGRPVEPLTERDLQVIDAVEKGLVSEEEYVDYLNGAKGLSWTVADLVGVWARNFTVNAVGRGLFESARAAGVPVFTLSNIAKHHIDAIEGNWTGFFDGADGLFMSYRIGSRKPEAAIYRHVLDRLGARGDQCFFIDDRSDNIAAARAVGIEAHQFVSENHDAVFAAASDFFGVPMG